LEMKKVIFTMFVLVLTQVVLGGSDFETYDLGKVHLNSGYIIQGDNLTLRDSTVTIILAGNLKSYKMAEINTIYAGEKSSRFNKMGAFIGCAGVMLPLIIIGGDFTDYFMSATVPMSVIGGSVIGFATPMLLRSVGKDGIKWNLIYSK